MKKYTKSILMILLLVLILPVSASLYYYAMHSMDRGILSGPKVDNPAPPDTGYLKELGMEPFVSRLPVMMIHTGGKQIMKESLQWVQFAILDDPSGENDIMGQADVLMYGTIKHRGASSYSGFDKPQYRIQFCHQAGGNPKSYPLFGMGKDSQWVLNGPFLDRTLIRNALMYQLSGEVMDYAPDCRFFELFIDGRYQGVYLAVEPITDGGSRLALNQFGLVSGQTPYIVKRDRVGTEENVLHTYGEEIFRTGNELSVSHPGISSLTEKQRRWIEEDISEFEKALYGEHFTDPDTGYAAYIDVDSFAEYYILNEFSLNHDAGMLSTYAYKDMNQKLRLCVWDFNNCFDNYRWFTMDPEQLYLTDVNWFERLLQDRAFVDRVIVRYKELRETVLSDAHIHQLVQQNLQLLEDAGRRNFQLWGYTFSVPLLAPENPEYLRDPRNYEEAVAQLTDCIEKRLAFLDNSLDILYNNCTN